MPFDHENLMQQDFSMQPRADGDDGIPKMLFFFMKYHSSSRGAFVE